MQTSELLDDGLVDADFAEMDSRPAPGFGPVLLGFVFVLGILLGAAL